MSKEREGWVGCWYYVVCRSWRFAENCCLLCLCHAAGCVVLSSTLSITLSNVTHFSLSSLQCHRLTTFLGGFCLSISSPSLKRACCPLRTSFLEACWRIMIVSLLLS
jgi:hypothetical protein